MENKKHWNILQQLYNIVKVFDFTVVTLAVVEWSNCWNEYLGLLVKVCARYMKGFNSRNNDVLEYYLWEISFSYRS